MAPALRVVADQEPGAGAAVRGRAAKSHRRPDLRHLLAGGVEREGVQRRQIVRLFARHQHQPLALGPELDQEGQPGLAGQVEGRRGLPGAEVEDLQLREARPVGAHDRDPFGLGIEAEHVVEVPFTRRGLDLLRGIDRFRIALARVRGDRKTTQADQEARRRTQELSRERGCMPARATC